jgi:hypothetical protein
MTPGEFHAKLKGFNEYQSKLHEREEELMLWQAWIGGYVAASGFGGQLPDLEQMLIEHRKARTRVQITESSPDEDQKLIQLAKEKGLTIPE